MIRAISFNTSGARPFKSESVVREQGLVEAVQWDSRVDNFNKRLELVRKCYTGKPEELAAWEREIREVSLYECYWRYNIYRGSVKRSARSVALILTPSFSADSACVKHANHDSRGCLVASYEY